jgi:hypothetical protein
MRTVEAYVGNGIFSWILLDKEVLALNSENLNFPQLNGISKVTKLEDKLNKEHQRNPKAVGYIDGKVLAITLYDDQTWSGMIWSSRTRISGTYKKV